MMYRVTRLTLTFKVYNVNGVTSTTGADNGDGVFISSMLIS